ncbi:hypothetical protein OF820_06195 [Oceanotoga sp. DSM 15011]|uniref:hypothetical protein n=1 Tax=Oceanotoga sp. DSM 15011 TaxID=2984951 RepID=UPI0021F4BFC0|nr:hypothetical protein [Oceanotoga sp. DSM 15011]UYP01276.1 hypothetical protein OF820_06195 [Oceanotoga sp. DSM 15011]
MKQIYLSETAQKKLNKFGINRKNIIDVIKFGKYYNYKNYKVYYIPKKKIMKYKNLEIYKNLFIISDGKNIINIQKTDKLKILN